jgi:parallel beta-helix repeat protein
MAGRKNHNSRMTLVAAFLMISGIGMPLTASAGGYGNYPLEFNPDWVISNDTSVWDESYTVSGNIIVMEGGNLTFENVSIYFAGSYNGEYRFEVQDGGQIHIKDKNGVPSVIASSNQYSYRFLISSGASAEISNSLITDCGYDDWNGPTNNNTGLWITSPNVTISNCNLSGNHVGIYIYDTFGVSITDCILSSNAYGIYVQKSHDLVISGNVIENCEEDGIYLSPNGCGYQTLDYSNLILNNDFNGGYLNDWELSISGSSTISVSTQQYLSEDKSLFLDSTGNGRAYATTPELEYDSDFPYNITTNIYLPNLNNYLFDVISNGQITIYLDGTSLKAWYDGSGHFISSLAASSWYNIRCDVTPSGSSGTYDIYIDDVYCETADFDEEDSWPIIGMGEESVDDSTYGNLYIDDISLTNSTTSIVFDKHNISINNNHISNCEIGIDCLQGTCVNISQNQITDCAKGIYSSETNINTISNNIVGCINGIQISEGYYYEGEITGVEQLPIESSNYTTIDIPGGATIIDASFNLSGSTLTNLAMDIGCDDVIEWQSDGSFNDLMTSLASSTLVNPMNEVLKEQYIVETNHIQIKWMSGSTGELIISNISIKYFVLSIQGDSVTNASGDGIIVEDSQITMSNIVFNNIASSKVTLDDSIVSSIGCNLEYNEVDVDSSSTIYMSNYLEIELKDRSGAYIQDGYIIIKEWDSSIIFDRNSPTGDTIIQARYCTKSTETTTYTPHNITAQKSNITQYEDKTMNQSQTISFIFSRLDLRAVDLSISNEYPILNDEISINAIIYNEGYEGATGDFTVRFYLNNTTDNIFIGERTINGLNAWDDSNLMDISTIVDETGYFSVVAKIDDDNNITEDVETNNISYYNILVCDECKDEWSVTTEISYDNKVVVADSLSISSDLQFGDGILKILDGDIMVSSNGNLSINKSSIVANDIYVENGKINTDNVSIGINNEWDGQHNIFIDQTSNANINNTLFYCENEETYFNITVSGDATITNTTIANMDEGLKIESSNVEIDNIGIHNSNKYGMKIFSSTITISNSIIANNNENDVLIDDSDVTMIDCDFNRSKIDLESGTLNAIGTMKIRVIDNNSENISGADVIVKDLKQDCIFSGETDINGLLSIDNGRIFTMNIIDEQCLTFFNTPYSIVVNKDGLSNVTKLWNIGPDMNCEIQIVMLKNENEWDNIWMTEFNINIPQGVEGAFSSEPFYDGMTFCTHVYNINASNMLLSLTSQNEGSGNDMDDIFYDVAINDELGNSLSVSTTYGYGSLAVGSPTTIPPGHYDVLWKYWNDNDCSNMTITPNTGKICYISCDAVSINPDNIAFPKSENYDVNISFTTDNSREIFLYGYTKAIDGGLFDNSHITNVLGLNGSMISTLTKNEKPLYANSIFGYYLGTEDDSYYATFSLAICSSNSVEYSPITFLMEINEYGWISPESNDLGGNGIFDIYEDNSPDEEGEIGGRADSRYDYYYIEDTEDTVVAQYEGWYSSKDHNIALGDCVLRRGHNYRIYSPNCQELHIYGAKNNEYYQQWPGCSWINDPTNNDFRILQLTSACDVGIFLLSIGYKKGDKQGEGGGNNNGYFGGGNTPTTYIEVTRFNVYIILDLPTTSGSDYKTQLTVEASSQWLYCYGVGMNTIDPGMDTTGVYFQDDGSSYVGYGTNMVNSYTPPSNAFTFGGLNQFDKDVYQFACAAAYRTSSLSSIAYRIGVFTDRMIHGRWGGVSPTTITVSVDAKFQNKDLLCAFNEDNIDYSRAGGDAKKYPFGVTQQVGNYQCMDFAGISTALFRAIGIPARLVEGKGRYVNSPVSTRWDFHVWTEIWRSDVPNPEWRVYDCTGCDYTSLSDSTPVDKDANGNYFRLGYTPTTYLQYANKWGYPANQEIYIFWKTAGNAGQRISLHDNYY